MEFVDRPFPKTLDTFIVGVVRGVYESFFLCSLSVFCFSRKRKTISAFARFLSCKLAIFIPISPRFRSGTVMQIWRPKEKKTSFHFKTQAFLGKLE